MLKLKIMLEEVWNKTKKRLVGYTLSNAKSYAVPIHVISNEILQEEEILAIEDGSRLLVGVLRNLCSLEPSLRQEDTSHFIWKPELLKECQELLSSYVTGNVYIIGQVVEENGKVIMQENRMPPKAGRYVYAIESPEILESCVKIDNALRVGIHKYAKWQFPLDPKFLNYHIGIFGATGTGKSRLCVALVREIISKTGYNVIVFDHSGVDYVNFFENAEIIDSSKIYIPPNIIANTLVKQANLSWQSYGDYFEIVTMIYDELRAGSFKSSEFLQALLELMQRLRERERRVNVPRIFEEVVSTQAQATLRGFSNDTASSIIAKEGWNVKLFVDMLSDIMLSLGSRAPNIIKAASFIYWFINQKDFQKLNERSVKAEDIVRTALERRIAIVDMSKDSEIEIKRAIVKSIMDAAWQITLAAAKPLNLIFVIDEAQNYACSEWTLCKDVIEKTAREGRKWQLGIILLSQRIVADIDASIRANLNTIFFGKLTAQTDVNELSKYLALAGVDYPTLARLQEREFFVAGLMNPIDVPILINVKEVN